MDQEKIGRFIQQKRKEKQLTQQQLADELHLSVNAVSKWERGLNMCDVSIMPALCKILGISLNELFAGETLNEDAYKEVADKNLLSALENSTFTLKDKIEYFKKKWIQEHRFDIIWDCLVLIGVVFILKWQSVEFYVIGFVAGIMILLFYVIYYNRMMAYVERNAYGNLKEK